MNLTVGLAGSGADVIVSGTAEDEVNQALADVGASGGGSVTLLGGLYSIASSISMTYSNVTLQGAGAGQTILRTVPAFAAGTSMIAAVGIDDFTIQNLTVDGHTNDTRANGITTKECTNGTIAGCEVLLSEGHNYGIWLIQSQHIQVLDNSVDGFTPAEGQEAIETYNTDHILISGNTIANIGGAAFNLMCVPEPFSGDNAGQNTNIQVLNNIVDNVTVGTWIVLAGPRSFGQIEVQGNTITNADYGVLGVVIDELNGTESATVENPQSLHDINITNNQFSSDIGIYLANTSGPGVASFSNINASNNVISDASAAPIFVANIDDFTLDGNTITATGRELGGSPFDDFILGSNLANLLSGEAGADTFVFDANALTPVYAGAKVVDHILDYNQGDSGTFNAAEGDAVDVSALLTVGSGQPVANLVRVVQNDGRTLAVLQVDRDGSANGTNWTTVALLDGVAAGAGVNVIYNSSQPAATLSVQAGVTVNVDPEVSRPAGGSVSATKGQTFQVSSLFSGSDADGDTLTYYLYDGNTAANSGHFMIGGNAVAAGTIVAVSAAQLAQATFVAGAASTSDDIYVQAYDGTAYSGWDAMVKVAVPADINHAPTVSTPAGTNIAPTAGQSLQLSSLFSGSDIDGDTLTYFLYDANASASSGHFVVNGNAVAANTIYTVTAAQLAQATFVAGAAGVSDDIYVQAFDGKLYSGWNTSVHVTASGVNHAPVVNLPSGNSAQAIAGQSLQLSSLFAGSDVDGNTLSYYVYDANSAANSGHLVVGGNTVAGQTITAMTAAQLAQATFVAGAAGTFDDIYVQAFDGQLYSGWNTSVHVTAGGANHAPVVNLPSGNSAQAIAGQSLQLSSLFSGSDIDGNTLSYYIYDANSAANSGHFVVGGNTVAGQTITAMTAAQLAQATFVAGDAGTFDDIYVQAFDGQLYSGWNSTVHVTAIAPNNAPTVDRPAGTNIGATAGQTLQLSSLFAGNDLDGDPLSYFVYDNNAAANGGHVEIGGNVVTARTITAMSAAELAQATFVAGDAGTADDIFVQAFDGKAYSGWTTGVHIFV